MTRFVTCLVFLGMANPLCSAQESAVRAASPFAGDRQNVDSPAKATTVPLGTPLLIQSERNVPLRVGQSVSGRLIYPVDVNDGVVIPAGTAIMGKITSLQPDGPHRLQSRLRADFTPFRKATVNFDQILLSEGGSIDIATTPASNGAEVFRLLPPPPQQGGLVRRGLNTVVGGLKTQIAVFTGPGKRDRLVQFLYTQMPYHPQQLNKGVSWAIETTTAFTVTHSVAVDAATSNQSPEAKGTTADSQASPWVVQAYLQEPLSSATSAVGSPVRAIVAEPVFAADNRVAVPQGAILEGAVTQARPARRFGRGGVLRFDFNELVIPGEGATQHVQASLKGIDAADGRKLTMDREGKLTSKAENKLAVPLVLLVLAARPLDHDRGESALGKDAVASNSLGVIGFALGTAGGWRNVAAGFGYYGAALSIYNRWIKRGTEITFQKDTHVVVQTARRASKSLAEMNQ